MTPGKRQRWTIPGSGWSALTIKTMTALAPEATGRHQFLEQGGRTVFGIAETLLKGLQNCQQGIQTDQVGQRQRPHGLTAAQLHAGVDVLGSGQALLQGEDGLVEHRHQNPVDHETRTVAGADRGFADALGERQGAGMASLGGFQPANHFHQGHERYRVEEMQTDKALGLTDNGRQLADRQRRGIAGDDRLAADLLADLLEDAQLQLQVLASRLDHQTGVAQAGIVATGADAPQRGGALLLAQRALVHLPAKVALDARHGLDQGGFGYVHQRDRQTCKGTHLGNTAAHDAAANDTDNLVAHGRLPPAQTRSKIAAIPWPPPMHMVTRAKRPWVRCSSWMALVTMIAPVAPTGWPREMPEPFGLTLAGSKSSSRATAQAWAAKASLASITSRSATLRPARCRARRVAGNGPKPISTGSTSACA